MTGTASGTAAIRPFTVPIVDADEVEALRLHITASRWPDSEADQPCRLRREPGMAFTW